jgi:hypothetical protein
MERYWPGNNSEGQLGIGSSGNTVSVPTPVIGLSRVVAVSAGIENAMALRSDGTVWTWGSNQQGALGIILVLRQCAASRNRYQLLCYKMYRIFRAAKRFFLVLDQSGNVYSWGESEQMGRATLNSPRVHYTPTRMPTLANVRYIDAGQEVGTAIRNDGTVWTWGVGNTLGQGNVTYAAYPAQLAGITNAVSAKTAYLSGMAVRADGQAFVWGDNSSGSFCQAAPGSSNVPILGHQFAPGTRLLDALMCVEPSRGAAGSILTWGNAATLGYVPSNPGPYGCSFSPQAPGNVCPSTPPPAAAPCLHAYAHNSTTSNYTASQFMPANAQPYQAYDIGDPAQITTLNAGGGTK